MSKKIKTGEREKEKPQTTSPKQTEEKPETEEKPFDFGGLPARDLKKNLGCG
jgi:hypothetical protein